MTEPTKRPETEQQRTERVSHEERKAHAARTGEELEARFATPDE